MFFIWINDKDTEKVDMFNLLRSKVEKEIKMAKKHFYQNKFESCIGDSIQVIK